MMSPMPFRLDILEQNVVSDSDQGAERSNIYCGLPQDHLDFTSRHVVQLLSSIKQAVHNVWHRTLLRLGRSLALRRALNTTLILTWGALMIAAAWWCRFDAPIWVGLI